MTRSSNDYRNSTSISDELIIGNMILSSPLIAGLLATNPSRIGADLLDIGIFFCYFSGLFLAAVGASRVISRRLGWRHSAFLTWPIWICLVFLTVGIFAGIYANASYGHRGEHYVSEEILDVRFFVHWVAYLLAPIGVIVNPVWIGGDRGR